MKRKQFEALAAAVRETREGFGTNSVGADPFTLDRVSVKLAEVCASMDRSAGFQRSKFLDACGVRSRDA